MTIKERKPWRQTPLIESTVLSEAAGCRIFLKLENLQPGGSFKSRGIGNYLLRSIKRSADPERVHFYSSSGGNAGIAAVYAANFLGRPCTVVVPTSTSAMMIGRIRAAGAYEVVQYGATIRDADAYLREVVMKQAEEKGEEAIHVSPFDHPDIWEGHSSLVGELRQQLNELGEGAPDVIACSVGGGGLFNGIVEGIEGLGMQGLHQWEETTIVGMETQGADSLAYSLEANEHLTLPRITSQATTLGCARVSARTLELATKYRATGKFKNAVFSDAEAAMGAWRFADDERIMVELSCGVTVSLCYGGRLKRVLGRPVHPDEKVVLIVCGGQGVTSNMLEQWKIEFGDVDAGKLDSVKVDAGKLDAVKMDAVQMDAMQIDAVQMDAVKIDAMKMDAVQVDAVEVDAVQVDAVEVDAVQMDAVEVDAAKMDAGELDAVKMDTGMLDAVKVDAGMLNGHIDHVPSAITVSNGA